jgi:hypothetical protein
VPVSHNCSSPVQKSGCGRRTRRCTDAAACEATPESGYNKGTIRSDVRYRKVSKDVRRHRLISSDYIKTLPCHGRGREFESRRPRHSFQRSCFNFGQTIEDAKRPRVAALSRPFCALFFCYMAAASCVVEPNDSEVSEEKTNDSTAACASCFAGLIAWV